MSYRLHDSVPRRQGLRHFIECLGDFRPWDFFGIMFGGIMDMSLKRRAGAFLMENEVYDII